MAMRLHITHQTCDMLGIGPVESLSEESCEAW
jgi:hypothetical protein